MIRPALTLALATLVTVRAISRDAKVLAADTRAPNFGRAVAELIVGAVR